jgi:outer membrane protein assembly factor BamB
MRKVIPILALMILAITMSLSQLANSPWPMLGYDMQHNGRSQYNGPMANPVAKWTFTTGGKINSSPVIGADGTIYIGSDDGKLYAVNPDGTKKWEFTTNAKILYGSALVAADGTIYIGSIDNFLYAINPDGTQKWKFDTGSDVGEGLAIGTDNTIYVGSFNGKFFAINPDGTKKWEILFPNTNIHSAPALSRDGKTIYVGISNEIFFALNLDGTIKWQYSVGSIHRSIPAIGTDGTIYIGTMDQILFAFNPDGTVKWKYYAAQQVESGPSIAADGTIYICPRDATFYSINPDGTKKWSFYAGLSSSYESFPIIGANSTIYFGSYDKKVYALKPDGTMLWSFTLGGPTESSPAIGTDGTLYIGSTDNKLYAISGSGNTQTLAVTPPTTTINTGATQQFTATPAVGVTWTATGGTISNTGLFTAGNTAGTYTITAKNLTDTATANVTITAAQTLSITPPTATISTGATQQFTATPATGVTWTATGGTISNTGLYTAGNTAGTYVVTAKSAEGTSTASVTITAAQTPTISITAPNGGEQWQQGSAHPITWTSTGVPGNVKIDLFKGNVLNSTIIASTPNTGSFNWTVPANQAVGTDYQIMVSTVADATVKSQSAANFAVTVKQNGSGLANSAWPMRGHDLLHTGSSPYTGPATAAQKWAFTTGNKIWSSPAIGADGTIYLGSNDKKFYAINPDGTQRWTFTTGGLVRSVPAIGTDGTVYVGSWDKKFYAINPDGTQRWAFTTGDYVESSPAIGADGTVYVGSWDNKLYAINPNGTKRWEFTTNGNVYSSPVIGTDGTIYVGSNDNKLYAIYPDGRQRWAFSTGGYIWSSPAIGANGTVYVGSRDTKIYAINPDGTLYWSFTTGGEVQSSPAIGTDGTIYVGSDNNKLYAIKPDGTQRWSFTTSNMVRSSPSIGTDGTVYVGSHDNKLYAVNPNGTQRWAFTTGDLMWSTPAIGSDGIIYVGSYDGKLYAIGNGTQTLIITPPTATLNTGASQQFTATPATGVTWTATGGTISNTGLYTAGNTVGAFVVTAKSTAGTATASVTINSTQQQSLSAPIQLLPARGSVNVTTQSIIAWQPVNKAVSYTLNYATNNNFANPVVVTGTSTSATVSLSGNTRYYWRVKAIDANNLESAWSSAWYFTTVNQAIQIDAPTLITPADSAIDVPIKTTFTWSSVANVIAYDLEISKDATFTTKAAMGSATTSLTATLANNQLYYWRVRGKNGNNLGIWSTTGTFTTAAFVPTAGVDAAIANSKVGSPLFGFGVVNNDGTLQTVNVDQPINRQSEFNIVVKNTGNLPDNFLIATTSTINTKWKVTVYDIGGADISKKVFNGGWSSYTVKPGESVIMRLRFAAASGQTIDAANPPTQTIMLTAQSWKDITNGVATPASDTVVATAVLVKMSK